MSDNIVVMMHLPRVEVDDVVRNVPESGCQLEWYSSNP
jgi:hypothetical protein